VFNSALIS
jgi:superfamily II DNA helicase RecQ